MLEQTYLFEEENPEYVNIKIKRFVDYYFNSFLGNVNLDFPEMEENSAKPYLYDELLKHKNGINYVDR